MNKDLVRFIKFLIVGCINTGITYLCFIILRFIGVSPELSNTIGYVVGVINSFIWNKKWVFNTHNTNVLREAFSFFIIFLVCFTLQFIIFRFLIYQMNTNEYLAQLISMIIYTVLNYILNRLFSFK